MQNVSAHHPRRSFATTRAAVFPAALCLCAALGLTAACSSSSSSGPGVPPVEAQTPDQQPDSGVPDGLVQLQDDPGLQAEIPEIYHSGNNFANCK